MSKRKSLILSIVVLMHVFIISGCSTRSFICKAYPGSRLPKDKIAFVVNPPYKYGKSFIFPVNILSVDGVRLKRCFSPGPGMVELLPAKHSLLIKVYHADPWGNTIFKSNPKALNFEAEAGHTYLIKYTLNWYDEPEPKDISPFLSKELGTWDAWIQDITGQR